MFVDVQNPTSIIRFARRQLTGATLKDALNAATRVGTSGLFTMLEHRALSPNSSAEAEIITCQHIVMLRAMKARKLKPTILLRLDHIGLKIDSRKCLENLTGILASADSMGGCVLVGAEGRELTQQIASIVTLAQERRSTPIGVTLFAHQENAPQLLAAMLHRGIFVRLREYKPDPSEEVVDLHAKSQFMALAKKMLMSGVRCGLVTNETASVREIISFAKSYKIGTNKFEFHMDLGSDRALQKEIISNGCDIRVRIPFGPTRLGTKVRRLVSLKNELQYALHNFMRGEYV